MENLNIIKLVIIYFTNNRMINILFFQSLFISHHTHDMKLSIILKDTLGIALAVGHAHWLITYNFVSF